MQTSEGLFVTLPGPQKYVILDNVPQYSYNAAVDARGVEYPLKVTYGARKWLLRSELEGAIFPVTFELRNAPNTFFCTCVV